MNRDINDVMDTLRRSTDPEERVTVARSALATMSRSDDPVQWGRLQAQLGTDLLRLWFGGAQHVAKEAIEHLEQAVDALDPETDIDDWAAVMTDLASAYQERPEGDRSSNIESGIQVRRRVLDTLTQEGQPEQWAATHYNQGIAYRRREQGDPTDNLARAIGHYTSSLDVYTKARNPDMWAKVLNNLANAYLDSGGESQKDDIEQAIGLYHEVLTVHTHDAYPASWGKTQKNLATAYLGRIEGDRIDNVEHAIVKAEQALAVITPEATPGDWLRLLNVLAEAYIARVRGAPDRNQEIAAHYLDLRSKARGEEPSGLAYEASYIGGLLEDLLGADSWDRIRGLIVHHPILLTSLADQFLTDEMGKHAADPHLHAAFLERQDLLRRCRIDGVEAVFAGLEPQRLPQALRNLYQMLSQVDPERQPQQWAGLHGELGAEWSETEAGDRAANIELAFDHYWRAQSVFTRERAPGNWAIVEVNLGNAFRDRIRGDRPTNFDAAIGHFQNALAVFSPETEPDHWALAQHNLAHAYFTHPEQDPTENTERAISHYEQALEVRDAGPHDLGWASTHYNLGLAYAARLVGSPADNQQTALKHFFLSLEALSKGATPSQWADAHSRIARLLTETEDDELARHQEAIEHWSYALEVHTEEADPLAWARLHGNIGASYGRLASVDPESLEDAIDHLTMSLSVFTADRAPAEWAVTNANLAQIYVDRRQGEPAENVARAEDHSRQAFPHLADASPEQWARLHFSLATAHLSVSLEQAEHLTAAQDHLERALTVYTAESHPTLWIAAQASIMQILLDLPAEDPSGNTEKAIERGVTVVTSAAAETEPETAANTHRLLGRAYADRTEGPPTENIEQSIGHYEKALTSFPQDESPLTRARIENELAWLYNSRAGGSRAENIERGIAHATQALDAFDQESPDEWATVLNRLGNLYVNRALGDPGENVERALRFYEESLTVRTREASPNLWASTQDNMGIAYRNRVMGLKVENIEQAITHYEAAMQIRIDDPRPEKLADTRLNLGVAYVMRLRGNRSENIEVAIGLLNEALGTYSQASMPRRWAMAHLNLGSSYLEREAGDPKSNIEQALEHTLYALEVYTREDRPTDWATAQHSLGVTYRRRLVGDPDQNIKRSIHHFRQALLVRTREASPVAWAETHINLGSVLPDAEEAIAACRAALEVLTVDTTPHRYRLAQHGLAMTYFREGAWADAAEALRAAVGVTDLLYTTGATSEARRAELDQVKGFSSLMAYSLARQGHVEEAVVTIESGKARLLADALARNEAALENISEDLKLRFEAARQSINELEAEARASDAGGRTFLEISGDLRRVRSVMTSAIDEIRREQPEFMPVGLTWDDIAGLASDLTQPLVFVLTTPHGSLGLLVVPMPHADGATAEAVRLDSFTDADLSDLIFRPGEDRYLQLLLGETDVSVEVLDEILDGAGDRLMAPVVSRLRELGYSEAVLIPSGGVSVMPMHAIALHDVGFTVVPSCRALRTVAGDRDHIGAPVALVAVGDPASAAATPLVFAGQEVDAIASLFQVKKHPLKSFVGIDAQRNDVADAVPGATHVHFACHGRFDVDRPLDSALYLADSEQLSLRDVLSEVLDVSGARLVVLSACQTGLADIGNLDELVGFPAGFIQAGVPGVISTLWPVADVSTAVLVEHFYRSHIEEDLPPAAALRAAQIRMQRATAEDMDLATRYEAAYRTTGDPDMFRLMRYYRSNPDTLAFRHPYYWAGFVFSGV